MKRQRRNTFPQANSSVLEHVTKLEAQLNYTLERWGLAQEQLVAAHKRIEELEQQKIPSPQNFGPQEQDACSLFESDSKTVAMMNTSKHVVQFYETDDFLLDSLSEFIRAGLRVGDACIVVATMAHRERLEERLLAEGIDLAAAYTECVYIPLDAGEMLSKVMGDGLPAWERFVQVIESIIAQAAKSQRHVRIYGEMVALLWEQENRAAAIRLEEFWNELGKNHPFSLLCAYSMQCFAGEVHRAQFREICQQHSHVVPDESYTRLSNSDERLRAISLLQQKAHSLPIELAQRKQAQEALLHMAAIVESSDDAILSSNLDDIITSWNAAAERMYGYSAQEVVGQPVTFLFVLGRQDELRQIMTRVLQGERVDHFETVHVRKDGTRLTVSVTISPVKDSTGTIRGASAIARDITEQRYLEAKFRHLFDSDLIGMFVSNFAGTILEANNAFLDLFGYTREELLAGMVLLDALTPPEFRYQRQLTIKALQETGSLPTYEKECVHKSGKRISTLVAVKRIELKEICIGFVLDISERKELERRKDAFITTASHELRTPLTLVQGYLDLLSETNHLTPDLHRFFLNNARCACDELVLLLANIMDANRIEFDRKDLHCSHLPLKEVCSSLVAQFEPWTLSEQRQVVVDIAESLTVWADEMRFKQILRNLIANALHYSPPQTPLWIMAALEQENKMVRLSVRDRGQGIPPDKQQTIFDKFVRLDRELCSPVRGSGLGLYISRQLVEAMGGMITVTSSGINGDGSCFSILLPTSGEAKIEARYFREDT